MTSALNPALYAALQARYGTVKITNQGQRRIESGTGRDTVVTVRGENYAICCPLCGESKFVTMKTVMCAAMNSTRLFFKICKPMRWEY